MPPSSPLSHHTIRSQISITRDDENKKNCKINKICISSNKEAQCNGLFHGLYNISIKHTNEGERKIKQYRK